MYDNDNTKLSKDFIVQIESMVKVAVGQRGKFDIKVKTQSSKTSNIYIYTENRKDTKRKLKAALRKKGSNFATGGGYRVRSKIFTGSNFSGLTYVVKQEGDKKSYKIILRFKEIFTGVKGAVKKKENFGMVFERLLTKDFKRFAKTKTADARGIKYKKFIRSFVNDVGLDDNVDLIEVIHAGGANTKRPLVFSGTNIYVADKDPRIGNKVTDLTLNTSKGLEYLST